MDAMHHIIRLAWSGAFILGMVLGCNTANHEVSSDSGSHPTDVAPNTPLDNADDHLTDKIVGHSSSTQSTAAPHTTADSHPDPSVTNAINSDVQAATHSSGTDKSQERVTSSSDSKNQTQQVTAASYAPAQEQGPADAEAWQTLTRYRWLVLAPDGPLIIDWVVYIGDKSWAERFREFYSQAGELVGMSDTAPVGWSFLISQSLLKPGDMNMFNSPAEQVRQYVQMFDRNRDGLVQEGELQEYLKFQAIYRDTFQLTVTEMNPLPFAQATTGLWAALDLDGDGVLNNEECKQATSVVTRFDRDDDETVDFQEVFANERSRRSTSVAMPATPAAAKSSVLILDGRLSWDNVLYRLEERYAFGLPLPRDCWKETTLFSALDENADGQISESEIASLSKVPPHVVLKVHWSYAEESATNPRAESQQTQSSVSLPGEEASRAGVMPSLQCVACPRYTTNRPTMSEIAKGQWIVHFPTNSILQIRLFDNVPERKEQFDLLWKSMDRDQNDYLDQQELALLAGQLEIASEQWDRNGDQKVDRSEWWAMLRSFLTISCLQLRVELTESRDTLFDFLDANHDGRLTSREIANLHQRLIQQDTDHDGRICADEIPGSWRITLVRGRATPLIAPAAEPGPNIDPAKELLWFRAMDANGDGDLSFREFLGTAEMFHRLDRDSDGLISYEEALQSGEFLEENATQKHDDARGLQEINQAEAAGRAHLGRP